MEPQWNTSFTGPNSAPVTDGGADVIESQNMT